jgi:hypothetical protein
MSVHVGRLHSNTGLIGTLAGPGTDVCSQHLLRLKILRRGLALPFEARCCGRLLYYCRTDGLGSHSKARAAPLGNKPRT